MKIFLSYGHDEYESLARKIKLDLEQEGFEVWIDKERIRGSADWEIAIENGINSSDWIVLLMTEHSVRRPDGVCLDEISYARFLGKNIAPIMVQEVKPPLCIARIQWIDMKNFIVPGKAFFDEESYLKRKEELIDILGGLQKINYETKQVSLQEYLNPLDNDVYSEYFIREFFGRENLLKKYNDWMNTNDRVLWIRGDAGSGKTSFIAHLSKISDEIQAVHFCRYNDNERANPKRAIMSLAYYMSTQIPAYRDELLNLNDLGNLIEKSTNRLFEYLIIEPLRKIPYQSRIMVLVIDALDEANLDDRNELADVIYQQFLNTPEWLKLIVTSRNDASLKRKLSKFTNIDISENIDENYSDIHGYLSLYLHDYLPKGNIGKNILNILTDKSQGLFLYAKTVTDEIRKGQLSIDKIEEFPDGLTGIYLSYFNRIFEQEQTYSYKNDIRPIMELLCSTYSPLKPDNICEILDIDEYDMDEILELIQEMFPVKNNCIEPLHKSIIDWLSDSQLSGQYRVSTKKGHARISDYLLNNPQLEDYSTKYLCRHLIASLNYQKAKSCLCDLSMQKKRIAIMGLDSAIRNYLYEILLLKSGASSLVSDVFESQTFATLFSKHRKFLYNSGLYFELKKCNFSEFLKTKKENWDTDAEIGISYFHYITEDFNSTIDVVNHILSTRELTFVMREELLNLLGLCYRKHVDFELSKEKFELAYTIGKDNQEYYYQSTSPKIPSMARGIPHQGSNATCYSIHVGIP